jgi:hypothetical protein
VRAASALAGRLARQRGVRASVSLVPRLAIVRFVLCALAVALAGVAAGCGSAARGSAAPPLWLSPAGNDDDSCSKAEPCATISRALGRAEAGGEILLRSGSYPAQDLHGAPDPAGKRPVVVRPAPGAQVRTGRLAIHTKNLELRGLRMTGWYAYADAGRLTLRDDHVRWFFVDSASDIRILGGTVGPSDAIDPQIRAADRDGAPVPRNILIDGVTFHDFTTRSDPSAHVECLQFGAGQHVIVRRSRFVNCADHSIFVGAWGGTATVRDFTFEDNKFVGVPGGYYSLRVASDDPQLTRDITVRRNSATTTMRVDPGTPGVVWEHNLAPRYGWECFPGMRYVANVWAGPKAVKCGRTDRLTTLRNALAAAKDVDRRPGTAGLLAR